MHAGSAKIGLSATRANAKLDAWLNRLLLTAAVSRPSLGSTGSAVRDVQIPDVASRILARIADTCERASSVRGLCGGIGAPTGRP
jgi:hypothetical protein